MRKQRGATLLEVLLTLAIGAAILYLSIQQYLSYEIYANTYQIRIYAAEMTEAMAMNYEASCYGSTVPAYQNGGTSPMFIPDQFVNTSYTSVGNGGGGSGDYGGGYSIGYASSGALLAPINPVNLYNAGTLASEPPVNPLVSAFSGAYIFAGNYQPASSPTAPGPTSLVQIIVAAEITSDNQYRAQLIQSLTNADCLSDSATDECSANKPGFYLLWESYPSARSPQATTVYWQSLPAAKIFLRQYQNVSAVGAPNSGGYTTGGPNGMFSCGS